MITLALWKVEVIRHGKDRHLIAYYPSRATAINATVDLARKGYHRTEITQVHHIVEKKS